MHHKFSTPWLRKTFGYTSVNIISDTISSTWNIFIEFFYWASTGVIASEKHGAEMNTVSYRRFDFYRGSSQESYTHQKQVYTKAWSMCHNALCFTRIRLFLHPTKHTTIFNKRAYLVSVAKCNSEASTNLLCTSVPWVIFWYITELPLVSALTTYTGQRSYLKFLGLGLTWNNVLLRELFNCIHLWFRQRCG